MSVLVKVNILKRNHMGLLLHGLKKTSDSVNYMILFEKLKAMGVKLVDCFYSYLTGRKQVDKINGLFRSPVILHVGYHKAVSPYRCYFCVILMIYQSVFIINYLYMLRQHYDCIFKNFSGDFKKIIS